ncbi:hypothetical protein [Brassicibacter mesophilus]|uniref:hypothetical protein n=1 Tax=Brassicibacter mesophilus TaxID=745119 RepID=UPI003D1C13C0
MKELTPFKKRSDRFQKSLLYTIEHFRKGNDHLGLDNFLNSIDDMENLLEYQQYAGDVKIKLDEIMPVLQILYDCIRNQDVTAMTDVLEFTVYSLTKEWNERCGD